MTELLLLLVRWINFILVTTITTINNELLLELLSLLLIRLVNWLINC